MEMYFKDKETLETEILLSEYLNMDEKEFESYFIQEDYRIKRTKYLMEVLGDVKFYKSVYITMIKEFHTYNSKYDVKVRKDTIKDIYYIITKYKKLTPEAIRIIWDRYIKDLFDEYDLIKIFDKYITLFGECDEAFETFIDYVDKKAKIHQEKYIEETSLVLELEGKYSARFVSYIKDLILREHYSYEEIKKYLPSSELVSKDEEHLLDLARRTRIHFGCCRPLSHAMVGILLEYGTLDMYPDELKYYVSSGLEESATFTKTEYLESMKKDEKVLKRKK